MSSDIFQKLDNEFVEMTVLIKSLEEFYPFKKGVRISSCA